MCKETDVRVPRTAGKLSFGDVWRGTKIYGSFLLAGKPFESQEVANARAATCAKCPHNQLVSSGCVRCTKLQTLAKEILGNLNTPSDGALKSCTICKCFNEVAVWFPLELNCKDLSEEQKAQFAYAREQVNCWKHC
jgi:hypothetical protein